ncbi:UNVERIFIED_CONTAM: DNA-binding protein WhiA [Campylobacter lari]
MSFTKEIKQEILEKKFNLKDSYAFVRGVVHSKALILDDVIKLRINDVLTRTTVLKLLTKIKVSHSSNNTIIKINKDEFNLIENFESPSAYFQGAFVGGGTISNLNYSSYHLQLSSNYELFIDIMMNKLNDYDFSFTKIMHKNKYLIYIKKHEKITDFLKAIIATNSLFNFMDKIINRDFENNINRLNNIDLSNIKKSVHANLKHIQNIKKVYENGLEGKFNAHQLNFFKLILENPDASLSSLATLFNERNEKQITKSGIYHWLEKLNNKVGNL